MEATQIILVVSVGTLTIILSLVGVQVVRILKEVKITIEKINKILEDMGRVTENVAKPTSSFNGIFFGLKAGLKILKLLMSRDKRRKENEPRSE